MHISGIACVDNKRGLGRDGDLVVRLQSDMAWFRARTMGKPVIMGRATAESLPKPLLGRANIVLSRQAKALPSGFVVVNGWAEAMVEAENFYRDHPPSGIQSLHRKKYLNAVQGWANELANDWAFPDLLSHSHEVMVIGGGQIYNQALPLMHTFDLTIADVECTSDTTLVPLDGFEKAGAFSLPTNHDEVDAHVCFYQSMLLENI